MEPQKKLWTPDDNAIKLIKKKRPSQNTSTDMHMGVVCACASFFIIIVVLYVLRPGFACDLPNSNEFAVLPSLVFAGAVAMGCFVATRVGRKWCE